MFITWPSQKVGESSGSLGNRGEGKKGTVGLVERQTGKAGTHALFSPAFFPVCR
jgi:hypothetical protein